MAKDEQLKAGGAQSPAKAQQSNDVVDASADMVLHPADVGYSLTSHGDGSPSISKQLVERREEVAKFNADPDRENREVAKKLGLL